MEKMDQFISISITDSVEARKVAYVKIGQKDIVAGTFSQTGEEDIHATYHDNGHCHLKKIKEGKIEESDLFDGEPISRFKGKINFFNRFFPTDISKLPEKVSITANGSEDIKLKIKGGERPHLMSVFLIETGRKDLLPDISKDEYILFDQSSPWILVTFFVPSEDKWNRIMKNLQQNQYVCYDLYQAEMVSSEKPMNVSFWVPPEFNRKRDSAKISLDLEKLE